jgi:hypothetical protein
MNLTRRAALRGIVAFTILPSSSVLRAFSAAEFGAIGDPSVDAAPAFARGILAAAQAGRRFEIGAGVHAIRSAALTITGCEAIRVNCAPGARIIDFGRLLYGPDGTPRRIPWGIAFDRCGTLDWSGGTVVTLGSGLGGASRGLFSAATLVQRRPVIGIDRCVSARFADLTLSGRGGAGSSWDDLLAMPGFRRDPARLAEAVLANAFFRASNCATVTIADGRLAPGRCAREMWGIVNCGRVVVRDLSSHSRIANFASLAKIIRCHDVDVQGISVSDPGTGSLVDVIARRFRYAGVDIDFPNGKLLDISHEWRSINAPIESGLVEDCRTTGAGVVTVHGGSTPAEIAEAPIGAITLRNVTAYDGARSSERARSYMRLVDARRVAIIGSRLRNLALSRPSSVSQFVTATDCDLAWDAGLDDATRSIGASGRNLYERCHFAGEGAEPVPVFVDAVPGTPGRHDFQGCTFRNVLMVLRSPATFRDCTWAGGARTVR